MFSSYSNQSKNIPKLTIKFVDFNIETLIKVDNDSFERYFKNQYRTLIVTKPDEIKKILDMVLNLKKNNSDKNTPNVRLKMEIEFDGNVNVICMDYSRISLNRLSVYNSKRLRKELSKLLCYKLY